MKEVVMPVDEAARKPPQRASDSHATDILTKVIGDAVREALNSAPAASNSRRLVSVQGAAEYLGCSKREIFYKIERGDLKPIKHGRKTVLDVQDLDAWIARAKGR